MGRLRKREPVHFGIDTFYAYLWRKNGFDGWMDYASGREIQKSPLDVLSENSTILGYDIDTRIELLPNMSDKKFGKYFIVSDKITNVKMAFICFGKAKDTGGVERKDRIEVTGSGLILRPMSWWMKLIDDLAFEISGFKRVDICIDVKLPTDYLVKDVFLPNIISLKKTHKPHNIRGVYTGLEIGDKSPSNTWKFIRIYNKILDTNVKDKSFLYDFEKMGPDYTRIEVELRRDKCRNLPVDILTNIDAQYDILAYEVFWTHYQFFKHIHKEGAIACVESHLIECFRDTSGKFRKNNVTAGMSRKMLIERMDRLDKFGSGYKTEKDSRRALSILKNTYGRVRSEGIISKNDIQEIFSQIEMEISLRKEGKIVDHSDPG